MSLFDVFNIAGSGMTAQSLRLNVTASNLANAGSLASSAAQAYRAKEPVFAAALMQAQQSGDPTSVGVQVKGITQSKAPVEPLYMPDNPLADSHGYVYRSNVNSVEEMVNMISASRSYQNDVNVMSTSRDLLLRTLQLAK